MRHENNKPTTTLFLIFTHAYVYVNTQQNQLFSLLLFCVHTRARARTHTMELLWWIDDGVALGVLIGDF